MEAIKQTQIKEASMITFPQRNSQKSLQGSLRFLEPDQKATGPFLTEILSVVVNSRQSLCNDFKWPHLKAHYHKWNSS